jgi:hypothetical protein
MGTVLKQWGVALRQLRFWPWTYRKMRPETHRMKRFQHSAIRYESSENMLKCLARES